MKAFSNVLTDVRLNKFRRDYPDRKDSRYKNGVIFPNFLPKFGIKFDEKQSIFTIGSCFARNIEDALADTGVNLPTKRFKAPSVEWAARPNGLLNEYNPGSIFQRISAAFEGSSFSEETIVQNGKLFADLLLLGGADVSRERAIARRAEIANIYKELPSCEVIIITLGFVETWFDNESRCFLNRMPPIAVAAAQPNRFVFKRMDVFDAMPLLEKAMQMLGGAGKRVVLSVSPVPIQTTFDQEDCVVANEFSKSVLRVCADRLSRNFSHVDYFPSYEIIRTAGLSAYEEDNVHVSNQLVMQITAAMIEAYRAAVPDGNAQ